MNLSTTRKKSIIITLILGVIICAIMFFSLTKVSKAETYKTYDSPKNDFNIEVGINNTLDLNDGYSNFYSNIYEYGDLSFLFNEQYQVSDTDFENKSLFCVNLNKGLYEGYALFHVVADAPITYLVLDFDGRIAHYDGSINHPDSIDTCKNCFVNVYVSKQDSFTDYSVKRFDAVANGGFSSYSVDLLDIYPSLLGQQDFYLRFDLDGLYDWTMIERLSLNTVDPAKHYSVSTSEEVSFKEPTGLEVWQDTAKVYKDLGVKYFNNDAYYEGHKGVKTSSNEDGYVVYKIVSNSGKYIYSQKVIYYGRVFHLTTGTTPDVHPVDDDCRVDVFVCDNEGFTDNTTFKVGTIEATDGTGSTISKEFDISSYAYGKTEIFVKFVLNGSDNWVTLEKVTFDGQENYNGKDMVNIDILNADQNNTVVTNSSVMVKKAIVSSVNALSEITYYDYVVSVFNENNQEVTCTKTDGDWYFKPLVDGSYKIVYTVTVPASPSDMVYKKNYTVNAESLSPMYSVSYNTEISFSVSNIFNAYVVNQDAVNAIKLYNSIVSNIGKSIYASVQTDLNNALAKLNEIKNLFDNADANDSKFRVALDYTSLYNSVNESISSLENALTSAQSSDYNSVVTNVNLANVKTQPLTSFDFNWRLLDSLGLYGNKNMEYFYATSPYFSGDHDGIFPITDSEEGYIMFNIKASDGKVFYEQGVATVGRVFHYGHDTPCDTGCGMKVYVSVDPSFPDDQSKTLLVSDVVANTDGNSSARTFDFSTFANGKDEIFVKIIVKGVTNWVSIESVIFYGEETFAGREKVNIDITDPEKDIVLSNGDRFIAKEANAFDKSKTYDNITVSVKTPSGTIVDSKDFIVSELGKYTVTYKVLVDSTYEYTNSYDFYVVENATTSGINIQDYLYRENTTFSTVSNYSLGEGSTLTPTTSDPKTSCLKIEGSAGYLLPIDFKDRVNFVFNLEKFESGSKFIFAVTSNPGIVDFSTMTNDGMYFSFIVVKNGSGMRLSLNGFFTGLNSSNKYVVGASMGAADIAFTTGMDVGIGLYKRVISETGGSRDVIDVFFNGARGCYYSTNYNPNSFIGEDNKVYYSFSNVKSETATINLQNIYQSDSASPILAWAEEQRDEYGEIIAEKHSYVYDSLFDEYTENVYVDDNFMLPNFELFDTKDGIRPFVLTIIDPNGEVVEYSEVNVGGYTRYLIKIEYEGVYSLQYTSSDYSENSILDIRKFTTYYRDDSLMLDFGAEEILPYGRVGRSVYLPCPTVWVVKDKGPDTKLDEHPEIIISVKKPDGKYDTNKVLPNSFYATFEQGVYEFTYSITTTIDIGGVPTDVTSKTFFSVLVKIDVDVEDSYDGFFDEDKWISYDMQNDRKITDVKHIKTLSDGSLMLFDGAYCKLPFLLYDEENPEHNGLELSIDISNLRDQLDGDAWACFGFGCSPTTGSFATYTEPGYVYIMFYKNNNEYWYTALYSKSDGTTGGLFTFSLGTQTTLTFGIDKVTNSASKTDNINFYFNHVATSVGTEALIPFSDIVDNEGFVYVNFWANGSGAEPEKFKSVIVKSINVCDQSAPEFIIEGGESALPKSFKLGEKITLPTITVKDNLDAEFIYSLGLYAPDGTEIDITKQFTVDQKGTYYLVMKAKDSSGNTVNTIKEFTVVSGGCGSVIGTTEIIVPIISLLSVSALFVVFRAYKRKKALNKGEKL